MKFAVSLAIAAASVSAAVAFYKEGTTIRDRKGKILSVFQVVTFPNSPCDGGSKNGTCFTASECDARGGANAGACADGYGVCCITTITCGGSSEQNCTYFDSSTTAAGGCSVDVCPCGDNICQLRLDFANFVITGPTTDMDSVVKIQNGVPNAAGTGQAIATQCLTDTFSVTSGDSTAPPTICGTNTGEHMFVDSDADCNTLSFQLGANPVGQPAAATRAWSIKVTQFSCDFPNLAPQGCTQYFSGADSGTFESYNFQNGNGEQLANQQQVVCIRRERNNCRICYFAANVMDFDISGVTAAAANNMDTTCCGPGGEGTKGFDCVQIPGALDNAGAVAKSNICGRNAGLTPLTICSLNSPFVFNYRTDAYEANAIAAATDEADTLNNGFVLGYFMDSAICNVL